MKPRILSTVLALASLILAVRPAAASTLYWSANGTTQGGTGTWDTTNAHWGTTTSSFGTTWDNTANAADTARFGGATATPTVTLGTNITVGGLWFDTTAYTISGSTLTFGAANNTVTLYGIAAATITGTVAGSGNNLTLASAGIPTLNGLSALNGTLTLNGASSSGWSGTTTINPFATLSLAGANQALLNTSGLTLNGGGLSLVNTTSTEGGYDRVKNSSAITANGGTVTYQNTSGNNIAYAETVGSVSVNSGKLDIVAANNQTGTGTSAQTLTLDGLSQSGTAAVTFSAATTGPQASGNKNMIKVTGAGTSSTVNPWATVGTAATAQTDYAIYSSDYVIPAGIAASAESTWATAADTYTANAGLGAISLTGTHNITALRSISAANVVTSVTTGSPGTINLTSHTFNNGDAVVFSGTTAPTGLAFGTVYYVVNVGSGTFQVSATSGGTAINITGAGTAVKVTGATMLSSGNNLGTYGILNGGSGTLAIAASGTGALTLPSTTSGNLYLTAGGSSGVTVSAPITDNGSGALTLVLAGKQTFQGGTVPPGGGIWLAPVSGSPNSYSGGTVINSGDIFVNHGTSFTTETAFGAAGTSITFNGSASYNALFPGGNSQTSTNAHPIVLNNGAIMGVFFSGNVETLVFSGAISGNGGVAFQHPNNVTETINLSNPNNTFTGPVTIGRAPASGTSNLTLKVGSLADSAGAGSIQLMEGNPVLQYTGSTALALDNRQVVLFGATNRAGTAAALDASGTVSGTVTVNTDLTNSMNSGINRTFQLQGSNTGTNTFAGKISDGVGAVTPVTSLTKAGTGTWALSGANTYSGVTTVSQGTLSVNTLANGGTASAIGQSANSAGKLVLNGGTLKYTGPAQTTDRTFAIPANSSLNGSGTGALQFTQTGVISPDYTGTYSWTSGKSITALGSTADLAVGMKVTGTGIPVSTTITSIDSATQVTLNNTPTAAGTANFGYGARTLTLTGTDPDANTLAGVLQDSSAAGAGALSVTKTAAGTWTLSGANTYSGATAVSGGKLVVATGSGTRCTSAVTIANTAGCIFGVKLAAADGQWTSTKDLTVSGANSELDIDYNGTTPGTSTSQAPVKVVNLTANSGGTLKILGSSTSFTAGQTYPLINFTGTGPAAADPYTGLTLSLPTGMTGHLVTIANQLELVVDTAGSPYSNWAADPTHLFLGALTDTNASHDFDGGGLTTGVEWVVGGDPTDPSDDAAKAPTFDNTSDSTYFIFTYRRSDAANTDPNTAIKVEYGSDLSTWNPATNNGTTIIVTETNNAYPAVNGVGIDKVEVKISRSLATGNKLFARLNVVVP